MEAQNRKFVIITVDTNDADYIESINEVNHETLEKIHEVTRAIQKFEPYNGKEIVVGHLYNCRHNFPVDEMVREDLGELSAKQYYVEEKQLITEDQYQAFIELCPYNEYGFHTVKSVKVLAVIGEIKLI